MKQASQGHAEPGLSFRPDIEGLRAIAILLVVVYHAGLSWVPGGYIGVDVFFVVSGYLITGLLVTENETSGRLDFARFYARRARRLLPAAVLVIVVTLIAANFIYSPPELRSLANAAISMSLYFSNLWFAYSATDYLAEDAAPNALLHSWSLSVEEQFYFFWPLFIFLVIRVTRGRSRRGGLVIAMTALALLSYLGCIWLTQRAQPWAFFASPVRAWEFAVGGLGALIPLQWMTRNARLAQVLQWLGLAGIAYGTAMFDGNTRFPGSVAAIPAVGTALLLSGFVPGRRDLIAVVLASAPMQWIGRRSYSWYLWHWPVLILGEQWLAGEESVPAKAALVALSLVLADTSYRYFENPIRFHPLLAARKFLCLGLALTLTLACAATSLGWRQFSVIEARTPEQLRFTEARDDIPHIYASDCHLDLLVDKAVACEFGVKDSATTVVLLGDSHAAQWFPALETIAREQGWRLIPFTKSACPGALIPSFNRQLGRAYWECDRWREEVMTRILEMRPALVLLGHAAYVKTGPGVADQLIDETEWREGQRATLARLQTAGLRAAIIRDTPRPGFDGPECLARQARFPSRTRDCSFDRDPALPTLEHRLDLDAAKGMTQVSFIDMSTAICPQERCEGIDPASGLVRYRDTHHLTGRFVESLAPALKRVLVPLVSAPS